MIPIFLQPLNFESSISNRRLAKSTKILYFSFHFCFCFWNQIIKWTANICKGKGGKDQAFASPLPALFIGMAQEKAPPSPSQDLTLGWVRDALVRQEDSIVFALIERARFPYNAPTYNPSLFPQLGGRSLVEVFVRGAEGLQAKVPSSSSFPPLLAFFDFVQKFYAYSVWLQMLDCWSDRFASLDTARPSLCSWRPFDLKLNVPLFFLLLIFCAEV